MPRQMTREKLALLKAIYKDGSPVTTKKIEQIEEALEEAPAPQAPQITVDTEPIAKMLAEIKDCFTEMKTMKPPPPLARPHEEWEFQITRDRYGKIERVLAKSIK